MQQIRRSTLFISALVGFLVLSFSAYTQEYEFRNYSALEGLSQNQVFDILQDHKGYLTIATNGGGVNVFDGHSFSVIDQYNGLNTNRVLSLFEDKLNRLWIGTFDGLYKKEKDSIHHLNSTMNLPFERVFCIDEDDYGNIWIATENGVFAIQDDSVKHFNSKTGLKSNYIKSIEVDSLNNVWIGTDRGVDMITNLKLNNLPDLYEIPIKNVKIIKEDPSGGIWFGYSKGGLYYFNGNSVEKINALEDKSVNDIYIDNQNNKWIATNDGLINLSTKEIKTYGLESGLNSKIINSIIEDHEGNIWMGTADQGLFMLTNEKITRFNYSTRIIGSEIYSFYSDNKDFYLGSNKGVSIIDHQYKVKDQLILGQKVNTIDFFNNKMWYGTDHGIYLNDANHHTLNEMAILSLKEFQGKLYVGTFSNGLFVYDGYQFNSVDIDAKIIYKIFKDQNTLWIGTSEGIYSLSNNENLKKWDISSNLNFPVLDITKDASSNLWLATHGKGLIRFNPEKEKVYEEKKLNDALEQKVVQSIIVSDDNYLWIGSQAGLFKVDLNPLMDSSNYSLEDYVMNQDFNISECNRGALFVDNEFNLWIGTITGAVCYNYVHNASESKQPYSYLKSIRVDYDDFDFEPYCSKLDEDNMPVNLNLPFVHNHLCFDFVGLSFSSMNKVVYQYKLDGADKHWSKPTHNTTAIYSNLNPGTYSFVFRSSIDGKKWSTLSKPFKFKINSPFYQTLWFYIGICSLMFVLASLLHRFRIKRVKRTKNLLEQKVMTRTIEIVRQKEIIEAKNRDITDSIKYAKKIQDAVLPLTDSLRNVIPKSFIFFKPRDIVSGDFYWFNEINNKIIVAAVDCTGHGVPGALMSMIGNSLLKEIIVHEGITNPQVILKFLNREIQTILKQRYDDYSDHDGMDIALIEIDKESGKVNFAGALRPLYLVRNNVLTVIKGAPYSIGGIGEQNKIYKNVELDIEVGDQLYMSTDGFVDQFGGEKGKKFMAKRFKDTLLSYAKEDMLIQAELLEKEFINWKKDEEQVDDVLVIGLQF